MISLRADTRAFMAGLRAAGEALRRVGRTLEAADLGHCDGLYGLPRDWSQPDAYHRAYLRGRLERRRWGRRGVIYTVGHRESYDRYFREQARPLKKGREPGYPGGSVWRTRAEAQERCPPGYAVYGVLADWETQTEPSRGGPWHDLLVDAPLLRLLPPRPPDTTTAPACGRPATSDPP